MKKINLDQRTKGILVGAFFLFALGLLLYNLFGENPTPTAQVPVIQYKDRIPAIELEKRVAEQGNPLTSAAPQPIPTQAISGSVIERMVSLSVGSSKEVKLPAEGRNLFIYPPAPPPPPVKPPLPPPITLQSLTPNSVFARTDKPIELIVRGAPFKEGVQIFLDNMALSTQMAGPNELHATILPNVFSAQRTISIMVKDPSDAKMVSGNLFFQVNDPPRPSLNYIGWVAEQGGKSPGAVITVTGPNGEEHQVLHEGQIFANRYRVTRIDRKEPYTLAFEDITLSGVRHEFPMTGSGGAGGSSMSSGSQPAGYSPNNQYNQYNQYNASVPANSNGYVQEETYQPPPQTSRPINVNTQLRAGAVDANGNRITQEEKIRQKEESLRNHRKGN